MLGPVSAGYPGKYAYMCAIIFAVFIYGIELKRFFKNRTAHPADNSTKDKATFFETPSISELIVLGLFFAFFIVVAFWSMEAHWPR